MRMTRWMRWFAVCAALALSACATGERREGPPNPTRSLGKASDGNIDAEVVDVVLQREFDEYFLRLRNASGEPVVVSSIAVLDSLGHRVEPGKSRGGLTDTTKRIKRLYYEAGIGVSMQTRFAAPGPGPELLAQFARVRAGPVGPIGPAAFVAIPVIALPAIAVSEVWMTHKVDGEIERHGARFPLTLQPGNEVVLDTFIPLAPSPRGVEIAYRAGSGETRVFVDIGDELAGLHLDLPAVVERRVEPRLSASQFLAGVDQGHVLAVVTVDGRGAVTDVEIMESVPEGHFDRIAEHFLFQWRFNAGPSGRIAPVRLDFSRESSR